MASDYKKLLNKNKKKKFADPKNMGVNMDMWYSAERKLTKCQLE